MALPSLLLPALFTGGSIAANTMAANRQARAQADTMAAERRRQRGFDREADAANLRARSQYEDFEPQREERSSNLAEMFSGIRDEEPMAPIAPPAPTSDNVVASRNERSQQQARDFTDQRADALGNLRGFGDLMGDMQRGQGREAQQIDMIRGLRRGSQGVLPMEMQAAEQKGGGLRLLGDILGGLGSMATGHALYADGASPLAGIFGGGGPGMTTGTPLTSSTPNLLPPPR